MSRDADLATAPSTGPAPIPDTSVRFQNGRSTDPETAENEFNRQTGVADWRDGAKLPKLSKDLLDEASGITIPSSKFVLRVILAYLITVIPLNWLLCRFVFNRREWTWVVVPLVALAFAIGVERVAARDIGYDTATDEIDLLEIHGDYPRAHLTRLVSLYSTGRSHFTISYPNDPTALALPFDNGLSIRGEDVSTSTWQSYPVPSLIDYTVQPRSLSMFRAEQMLTLSGAIRLDEEGGKRRLVNGGELELRDAILIDRAGPDAQRERWLGSIAAGAVVELGGTAAEQPPDAHRGRPWSRRQPYLGGIAHELGTPRRKSGRASPGRLGRRDDRRASDRAGRRSAPRFHRGRLSICAAAARRVPTAGATTGSPPGNRSWRLAIWSK